MDAGKRYIWQRRYIGNNSGLASPKEYCVEAILDREGGVTMGVNSAEVLQIPRKKEYRDAMGR